MVTLSETLRPLGPRCLVAALALIASFALDGLATRARSVVLAQVPDLLLFLFAEVGNPVTLAAVVILLLVWGQVARRSTLTRTGIVLASTLIVTALVVIMLKWLASRGPDGAFHGFGTGEGGIMFPSGHTAMAFAACTVIGSIWRKVRWPAWGLAAGVAISRVALTHFLSDAVAGALVGAAVSRGIAEWAVEAGFVDVNSNRRCQRPDSFGTATPIS